MLMIYRPDYVYTITHDPDEDFRRYLLRKLRAYSLAPTFCQMGKAQPLDISLDDPEGDVVAGIAAVTCAGKLYLDYLWVDATLRGHGIGRRLITMAEAEALKRGCFQARLSVSEAALPYFVGLGYAATGKLQDLHTGRTYFYLSKSLRASAGAAKDLA